MNEPQKEHPQETPTARAEVLVDQWGERVGRFLSSAGYQLRKATARAREEAEDILAEAQTIRHSSHPQERH